MTQSVRHVTAETRTVYRSARGVKLTKHAAYIAAAKKLIADRCAGWDEARLAAVTADDHEGDPVVAESYYGCAKTGPYQCRFHTVTPPTQSYPDYEPTGGGMLYYVRVLPRLVRFLKYVDGRRA